MMLGWTQAGPPGIIAGALGRLEMREGTEFVTAYADDCTPSVNERGQVELSLGFFRLPEGKDRFRLTLTMEAAQMKHLAEALLQKVAEAHATNVKH